MDKNDSWLNGSAYERFMGRWSVLVAQKFLRWLTVTPGKRWLDVGCGTGTLTRLILESYRPEEVIAIDSSSEFIAHALRALPHPAVHFQVGLAQSLDVASDSVDAVVSGLVLNFVPQAEAAIADMLRVTRPGGTVGIYLWDYARGMQMLRYFWDAAAALDAQAAQLDEGPRFTLCQEGKLEAQLRKAGLKQIEAAAIEIRTVFQNFDDFWQPFLGKVGAAPSYVASLALKDQQSLEEKLHQTLPIDADGSISLRARAWAVKGTV